MHVLYEILTSWSKPLLCSLLQKRLQAGKETLRSIDEKKAIITKARDENKSLIWLHAASVGEAQSALILIQTLINNYDEVNILITSGTITSAQLLEKNLPPNAIHQFYPLDHPDWVSSFLDHWRPDMSIWMESELWPNMLRQIDRRNIPAVLVNAHLSDKSYRFWKMLKRSARQILSLFDCILCQTEKDAVQFRSLVSTTDIVYTDNLKYSAAPLAHDSNSLSQMQGAFSGRPVWLYASTHKGEEEIACELHSRLKHDVPDLLTIIIPRHPQRSKEIEETLKKYTTLTVTFRGEEHALPKAETDIYVADTLGELGLFYRLAPIACIGRSFSDDGGGGHNPIEAMQLGCAVIHGPNVHNLQDIYDELDRHHAGINAETVEELQNSLMHYLTNEQDLAALQKKGLSLAQQKNNVIHAVMREITPILEKAGIHSKI